MTKKFSVDNTKESVDTVKSALKGIPKDDDFYVKVIHALDKGQIGNGNLESSIKKINDYKEKIKKDYRLSFGDYERQRRIRRGAAHNLFKFKQHMESLGLEHKVPKEIMKSLTLQWMGLERDVFTGGKMK